MLAHAFLAITTAIERATTTAESAMAETMSDCLIAGACRLLFHGVCKAVDDHANGEVTMRFRALTAVSALTALTLLGMVPVAQAAGPSAPTSNTEVKIEKLTPEMSQAVDAARTEAAESGTARSYYVCFQAHSRTAGWTNMVCSDGPGFTGTEGRNDPIDRVIFTVGGGLDFHTQVHFSNDGSTSEIYVPSSYQAEVSNVNGNVIEAIRLRSSNAPMKAAAHVQNVGWKGTDQWSYDQWIGSINEGRWMEAFWIDI
ncbi:hypothetical protein ACFU7Y_37290 [Kitasatospora sp. NPDC057542]|uniref:hypothetical protein n=1 Tax=Kitasatospora sp. NPDC057542 TaxID=3346162 RepID=UPI00368C96F9